MPKIWRMNSRNQAGSEADGTRPENRSLIRLNQVVKEYQTGAGSYTALKDIHLNIQQGEFIAIIGKSGSGKTTLLNMITGIDRPTSGEIFIGGAPLHQMSEGKLAVWRGNTVGIVFQFFQLFPTLTVIENILLPMDFCHRYTTSQRRERALSLLDQVDMHDQANKLPSALSGGQQQRAAIARALANDPPILIADEPTGNLDSHSSDAIFILFEHLVEQGKTVIMVTHDQDLARRIPRGIYLSDGRIVQDRRAAGETGPAGEPLRVSGGEIQA